MNNKSLFRFISALLVALVASLGFAATASAGNPHYIQGTPTVSIGDNSLTVSFKAAGLGNTAESADFSLTGEVTATAQCFTKSGNPVNGVPKMETTEVALTDTFPVRNGRVNGSFTVAPLTTLECTGKQYVQILDVSYDLWLTGEDIAAVHLVG